jgi:hypothetical protein
MMTVSRQIVYFIYLSLVIAVLGVNFHIKILKGTCKQFGSVGVALAVLSSPLSVPIVHAANLPSSTGASATKRRTAVSLAPIVKMKKSVLEAEAAFPHLNEVKEKLNAKTLPKTEKEFKRQFDEYSEGISYKQQYLDKNAFLVYYTAGFDGPGRKSIETDSESEIRQKSQYGFRNDAWVGLDEARAEVDYLIESGDSNTEELKQDLKKLNIAISSYLDLTTEEQLSEAEKL